MKIKSIYLSICCLMFFITSCYKDHSATDFKIVNPITVDWGGVSTSVNTYMGDTLRLKPIVYKNGVADDNLTYTWRIQENEHPVTVISNTMALEYEIKLAPNSDPYHLVLLIKDNTTGIELEELIQLKVLSRYGEGLMVAHTKDDANSDISLVMAMNFSRGVLEGDDRVFHNIYSSSNGVKVNGLIHSMQSLVKSDSRTFTIMTDKEIIRVDPFDMIYWQKDSELFYVPLDRVNPTTMCIRPYFKNEYIVNDGRIHFRNTSWGNLYYNFYMFVPAKGALTETDYFIRHSRSVGQGYYCSMPYAYDELGGRMLIVDNYSAKLLAFPDQSTEAIFDANNIGDYVSIGMEEAEGSCVAIIFKGKSSDERWIGVIKSSRSPDFNEENIARTKINITNCPDIDKAVGFAASPISSDFYYASEDKIYTFNINESGDAAPSVRYEANPGEKITNLMIWRGEYSRMVVPDDNSISGQSNVSANNRQLVITTHNESTGEGKVITIPIMRLADGTLETNRDYHMEFGGFGRITAISFNNHN